MNRHPGEQECCDCHEDKNLRQRDNLKDGIPVLSPEKSDYHEQSQRGKGEPC
jgi:hypothetical protein